MNLLLLECTPKSQKAREGLILYHFLSLPADKPFKVELQKFTDKNDFLSFLSKRKSLMHFDCIHLSGHGTVEKEGTFFHLPRGSVSPDEFPKHCFDDKCVALSACELGKIAFVDPFIKQTQVQYVVGPNREVPFMDAAVFWVNFYYYMLKENISPMTSFSKTKENLEGYVRGAFQFHETERY